MNARASIFLLVILFSASICIAKDGQVDSLTVFGRVLDRERQPIEGCILMIQKSDSTILSSAVTNEKGDYHISFPRTTGNLVLKLNGFNVKQQSIPIEPKSQMVNFTAIYESIIIKEVEVKARKLWGSRDTLNYLVSAYIKGQDRSIGDILRRLPGITIDGGTVKYQGVPINRFYIENMDVLEGKYAIATNGIRAEDVGSVQVMENHEHIKALQDQLPPGSAAINLKLKNKAKGRWMKSLDVGGGYDEGMLWNVNASFMYFDSRKQHVFYYESDNIGSSVNWLKSYYGGSNLGANHLTSILLPGVSPIGQSLRNNQNNLCLSNLNKLSETAQLHYNITYSHDIQRQNSYSQTVYLLPDATTRMISEDITSRVTTNATSLQLGFEDNTDKKYLRNKLVFAGRWSDAHGLVLSNGNPIRQYAFNRNLGLNNTTEWIRRTSNGGGFNLISSNFVQTNPQRLSIEQAMQAKQDIEICNIGSHNNFKLLRNLSLHRCVIAPTTSLNIDYVSLKSMLDNDQAPDAFHGDMGYLFLKGNIGANMQYIHNNFRLSFDLPLSLTYTDVTNEPIPEEQTKANRARVLFTPSFSMLWKGNDYWTFSTNGSYGLQPTNWRNLLTAYLMSNYKTLNRYRVSLTETKSASVSGKIQYKDILNEFFAYLSSSVSRRWSDVIYGTTIDRNAHTILQTEYAPNHSTSYTVTANVRKEIDWHDISIETTAGYNNSLSKLMRQSVMTDYHYMGFYLMGSLGIDITKYIRFTESCRWTNSKSKSGDYKSIIYDFSNDASLLIKIISNKLMLNTGVQYTHNSGFMDKKDYVFMNATLTYKPQKKFYIDINLDNLLNTKTFIRRSNGDLMENYTIYQIRPRSVMLTAHIIM